MDRRLLGEWAAGSRPLWDLLDRIPRRAAPPPCPDAQGRAVSATGGRWPGLVRPDWLRMGQVTLLFASRGCPIQSLTRHSVANHR